MVEYFKLEGMVICKDDEDVSWLNWGESPYPEDEGSIVCYTGRAYIYDDTLSLGRWKTMQQEKQTLSEVEKDIDELPQWDKTTYCDFGSGEKVRIKEDL